MVDICTIKDLTETQLVELCSKANAQAPAIIIFITMLVFFTIFGLSLVKVNRGKLGLILCLTALFSGAVLAWLLLSPNLVNNIVQWWIGMKG